MGRSVNLSRMAYVSHQSLPFPLSHFHLFLGESVVKPEKRGRGSRSITGHLKNAIWESTCILYLLTQGLLSSSGLSHHTLSDVTGVLRDCTLFCSLEQEVGHAVSLQIRCLESPIPIGHTVIGKENLQQVKGLWASSCSLAWGWWCNVGQGNLATWKSLKSSQAHSYHTEPQVCRIITLSSSQLEFSWQFLKSSPKLNSHHLAS